MNPAVAPEPRPVVLLLGGNRFEDCGTVIGAFGKPVLSVDVEPLRVALTVPPGVFPGDGIAVAPGVPPTGGAKVVVTDRSFAVFWQDHALLIATLLAPRTVHLKLDLRPAGIHIYDDADGLHVGTNVLRDNVVRSSAVAISLA